MKVYTERTRSGFTIIEILVVITLMAIAGTIITGIFISSLRGSEKANYLAVIKQNGQAVLDQIDKVVRSTDNIVCPILPGTAETLMVTKDGIYTRYRFYNGSNAVNGFLKKDNPLQFNAVSCDNSDPQSADAFKLTDDSMASGVSLISGSFYRYKKTGFKDGVDIKFTLKPAIGAPSVLQIDPVEFKTSVTLR